MLPFIKELLAKEHITLFAPLPLSECRIQRAYLLERAGIQDGTAIIMAVPYYTKACDAQDRNLSAYATGPDYHAFFASLFSRIIPTLQKQFPDYRFAGFADHSPIDEVHAAVHSGIGVPGDNRLLLTVPYSSYVFLGEIITNAQLPSDKTEPGACLHCGACRKACPMLTGKSETCLSALTQKKGELSDCEKQLLKEHPLVWGCDICQEVCPYTKRAKESGSIYSPIPFFADNAIPRLTLSVLDEMSDEAFAARAFSWRGRGVIRRNLLLHETGRQD